MANARATGFRAGRLPRRRLSAHVTLSGMDVYVDLAELIDVPAEIARKTQEVEKLTGFIAAKEKKLTNDELRRARTRPRWSRRSATASKDLQDQLAAAKEVLERLAALK